jgi:hypothetical protein
VINTWGVTMSEPVATQGLGVVGVVGNDDGGATP